jgi:hypothetical protein
MVHTSHYKTKKSRLKYIVHPLNLASFDFVPFGFWSSHPKNITLLQLSPSYAYHMY